MTLSITCQQLWQMLSYRDTFSNIPLVNYPEVSSYLLSLPQDALFAGGLYVDNRIPSQPILYSSQSWKQECQREQSIAKTLEQQKSKPSPKLQALLDKGFTLEHAKQIAELM